MSNIVKTKMVASVASVIQDTYKMTPNVYRVSCNFLIKWGRDISSEFFFFFFLNWKHTCFFLWCVKGTKKFNTIKDFYFLYVFIRVIWQIICHVLNCEWIWWRACFLALGHSLLVWAKNFSALKYSINQGHSINKTFFSSVFFGIVL